MKTKVHDKVRIDNRLTLLGLLFVLCVVLLMPESAKAQQTESMAECDEEGIPPIAEPVPLNYGDHTVGCLISPASEGDTFRFDGLSGDIVRVVVQGTTANFAPAMELRDGVNALVASGGCVPNTNGRCAFTTNGTLAMDGVFTIRVEEQGANNVGFYTLQLERLFPGPGVQRLIYDSTIEPNGDVLDDVSVADILSPATDIDSFYFQGVAGTLIRFNVQGQTANVATQIEVRDPTGTVVLDLGDGAGCIPNTNGMCSFASDLTPASTGNYTVVISERGSNNPGNYSLSLWCVVGDCDSDGDGNGDIHRIDLRYGESVSTPMISPATDGDFYDFMGTAGDEIQFNVTGQTANFAPALEVRDPAGLVVLDLNQGASCVPNTNGTCSFSVNFMPATTGSYTAVLFERGINNPGNYQFTLECIFSPGDLVCENLPGRFPGDVPEDYWAFSFIEILARRGITVGCGNGDTYCPLEPVTRAQMAVFIERGLNGGDFNPPAATGTVFNDVDAGSFAANFIERFYQDGITAGCGGGDYCPFGSVSRAQMAVFLLRAKHGANYSPPAATGVFNDVALDHWAAPWIEQLAAESITSGCGANIYCPGDPVTRDQMAVFLVRTFGL